MGGLLIQRTLATLVRDGRPTYAWDPADSRPWDPEAGLWARVARSLLPEEKRRF